MAGLVPAISLSKALLCGKALLCTPDRNARDRESAANLLFVVARNATGYIARMLATAHRILIADHARLPWRFFGRLTSVQAGL